MSIVPLNAANLQNTELKSPQSNFHFISENFPNPNNVLADTHPQGSISLYEGEKIQVEPSGLLASYNVKLETNLSSRGWWQIIKNYVFGGESLFYNLFEAQKGGGWVMLEESIPKQVLEATLHRGQGGVIMTQGSYVASSPHVDLDTSFAGISGIMKGKGIATTLAKVKIDQSQDSGKVYFNSVEGPIRTLRVSMDKPLIVDNEALVAYSEGLEVNLKRPGDSYKSLFLSGEGFVCEFKGEGYVFTGTNQLKAKNNHLHTQVKTQTANYIWLVPVVATVALGCIATFGLKDTAEFTGAVLKHFV